ncbi:MAG: VOC family protein [Candidatus Eisenbacteria bacterium]|nr:VOC family protein [Candidatus Eisenbacteria bacterium]
MTHPRIDDQITFIYTADMKASIDFYENKLELPLALDQGGCRIYRLAAGAYLGVCLRDAASLQAPDPGRRGIIVTIVTPDVEEWFAFLQDKGVSFETEPQENEDYGIVHAFLRDPNGYLIEIQRFIDPRWKDCGSP